MNISKITSDYFSVILIISCIIGMQIPSVGLYTGSIILFLLCLIIFTSFFQMQLNFSVLYTTFKQCALFIVLRFIIIPILLYFIIYQFSKFYAFSIFFLCLLPSGVSSPAYSKLFNANINLSLIILICSSFMVVATIPLLVPLFALKSINIGFTKLFITMLITIILPFIIHLPLRGNKNIVNFMNKNLSGITVFCLSIMFIIATAKNKMAIINNVTTIPQYVVVAFFCLLLFYVIGWYLFSGRKNKSNSIAYSVGSGMNNIGLGVSLATLYFDSQTCIFYIICQFVWVLLLLPLRYYFKRQVAQ